jgi:hypothetical protein
MNDFERKQELKTVKVSDSKIIVPRITKDTRKIKAGDIFSIPYPNIFICSMKASGKSTVLTNIIFKMMGKNTKLIIICNSINHDSIWLDAIKKIKKRGNDVILLNDIVEDGVDEIAEFLSEMKNNNSDEGEKDEESEIKQSGEQIKHLGHIRKPLYELVKKNEVKNDVKDEKQDEKQSGGNDKQDEKRALNKQSKIISEYLICLDDLGSSLRNKSLDQLVKTNRHYKCTVIISTQHLNDILPSTLRQMNYCLIFGKFSEDKLKELYKKFDIGVTYDEFYNMYKDATKQKYNFLFIDRPKNEFRSGFQNKYIK